MSESSKQYRNVIDKMGIPVIPISRAEEGAPYIHDADILVDALIGTGLSSEVKGEKALLITLMNEAQGIIISVDVPSGMLTDTGKAAGWWWMQTIRWHWICETGSCAVSRFFLHRQSALFAHWHS